jgi:competence protein ComEC
MMLAHVQFEVRASTLPVGMATHEGVVVLPPDVRTNSTLLIIALQDTRVLVTTDPHVDVAYGDTVRFSGELRPPEAFATDFGRTFDYPGFLRARGISHVVSFVSVEVVVEATASWRSLLYQIKDSFLATLTLVLPEPASSLGAGILLGVKSGLPADIEDAFATAGITHIVVLSGYNIMLVVVFVLTLGSLFLPYRLRLLVAIATVLLFAVMVGFAPSVARASLMAILVLVSYLLARPQGAFRALALAAFLIVLIEPYTLRYDVGFQFSFLATLGLILVAPIIERYLQLDGVWRSFGALLVATLATQIIVLPVLLYHIGLWSFVALPVNLLVVPLVPFAMLFTFIAGLLGYVSVGLAAPIALLATLVLDSIIGIAQLAASWPLASYVVPPFPAYVVFLLYGLFGVLYYRLCHPVAETVGAKTSVTDFATWTIVDEETLVPKAAGTRVPAAVGDPVSPIFFRE